MLAIYFGVPGSGKTTHAAMIVKKNLKKGVTTYSNVDIRGAVFYDTALLGTCEISGGDLIIDEASICFNNRNFKSLPQATIQWLKLYRHYGIRNVYVYSQSYEDMDVTLRRLADRLYIVRRSMLPYCHVIKPIMVSIGIDDQTHQIVQAYRFGLFFQTRRFFAPAYWSMFDSWAAPALPDGGLQRVACPLPVRATRGELRAYVRSLRWRPISHARKRISDCFQRGLAALKTMSRTFIFPICRKVAGFLHSRPV